MAGRGVQTQDGGPPAKPAPSGESPLIEWRFTTLADSERLLELGPPGSCRSPDPSTLGCGWLWRWASREVMKLR